MFQTDVQIIVAYSYAIHVADTIFIAFIACTGISVRKRMEQVKFIS